MLQNLTVLYEEDQRRWLYEHENSTEGETAGDEQHAGHAENCKDEVNKH